MKSWKLVSGILFTFAMLMINASVGYAQITITGSTQSGIGPTATATLTGSSSISGCSISDVNVHLGITHASDSDLAITLKSPANTTITLVNHHGAGANFTNTVFDDSAATSITAGGVPFKRTFKPEGTLSSFKSKKINGKRTLVAPENVRGEGKWSLGSSRMRITARG